MISSSRIIDGDLVKGRTVLLVVRYNVNRCNASRYNVFLNNNMQKTHKVALAAPIARQVVPIGKTVLSIVKELNILVLL